MLVTVWFVLFRFSTVSSTFFWLSASFFCFKDFTLMETHWVVGNFNHCFAYCPISFTLSALIIIFFSIQVLFFRYISTIIYLFLCLIPNCTQNCNKSVIPKAVVKNALSKSFIYFLCAHRHSHRTDGAFYK